MSTEERIFRHTMMAMEKILDPQQLSRRPAAQEGSSASLGTAEAGALSPKVKLEALMLAKMNEERAELCGDRPALREFFEMNAKFLKEIAQ